MKVRFYLVHEMLAGGV